jgi:peptide/nickel transport system permease protein
MSQSSASSGPAGAAGSRQHIESPFELMWHKFRAHKLAAISLWVIIAFYLVAIFANVLAPYDPERRHGLPLAPPLLPAIVVDGQFVWPPVAFGVKQELDRKTFQRVYTIDTEKRFPLQLFVEGDRHSFFGLFPSNRHLIGVDDGGAFFLMGTDALGRDMFSRILYGARISLSIGLVGVALSLVIGIALGGMSGYFGGAVDLAVQK